MVSRLRTIANHHPWTMQFKTCALDRTNGLSSLAGLSMFITGGNRGIGLATAMQAAKDGAKIAIAAKTTEPHPKLPETIYTAADKLREAGAEDVLAIQWDVRDEASVQAAVDQTVAKFGGIDLLVNNASAIMVQGTEAISMKHFDLCHGVTARGSFLVTKIWLPYLLASSHAHILNMSPPISTDPRVIGSMLPNAIAKMQMSMVILGISAEHPSIRANALWPRTLIGTSAVSNKMSPEAVQMCRNSDIMGLAAYEILKSKNATGQFFFDDEVILPKLDAFATCHPFELLPDVLT